MAAEPKLFNTTGVARTPEQCAVASKRQISVFVKARTWKRAHEIMNRYQNTISLNGFRTYTGISRNQGQLDASCDAEEGIWWSTLDYAADKKYHEIWSKPKTD
jgi:hypothetical protein